MRPRRAAWAAPAGRWGGNEILDTGLDCAGLGYPVHGIYAIGANVTVRSNVVRGFQNSGVSLCARGAVVEGNAISVGPIGVSFAPYDASGTTTRIAYNRITGIRAGADSPPPYGVVIYSESLYRNANPESFAIASNTIADAEAGIRVAGPPR